MLTGDKRCELDIVLSLLVKGYTKKKIRDKLDIKTTTLSNRLRRLEDLGCIERKGKYVINVLQSSHLNPKVTKNQVHKKLNKRGHAFNFKIIFPNEKNLKTKRNVQSELKLKKLEKLQFGSLKLIKDNNTIWINKDSLTIYSKNSYYSENAMHSKFRAMKDIDNLIYYLRGRYEFKGIYGIEVFREHYGLIFNEFAKWMLKKKKKMYVKNVNNKTIFWIDDSRKDDIGLKEFESSDPLKINSADNLFKSHEETGWKVTPEFILKGFAEQNKAIKGNADNINNYAKHLRAHVQSVKDLGAGVEKQNILFERMAIVLEKIEKGNTK